MSKNVVKVFALGGQAEKGKSLYGVEINNHIYIIESGYKFPDNENLGIDIIVADYQYLVQNKKRVKAIFITHGHDDVMAGLPYLLENVNVPIYAPTLCGDLIDNMIQSYSLLNKKKLKYELIRINRGSKIKIGQQNVQFFPLTHSFPGTVGISFDTKDGAVVFAGEFIVDPGAPENFQSDLIQMAEIGKKGVLCLMSESQGAERTGYTSPNHKVTAKLEPIFESQGRVIVTVFNQNVFRIKEIAELAIKFNRRIVFYTADIHDNTQKLLQTARHSRNPIIDIPAKNRAQKKDINGKDSKDLVVVITGSSKQLFADLVDILDGGDEYLKIRDTDRVVVASPVLPGTEMIASRAQDELFKACDHVTIFKAKEVWSTHAAAEDLKMMIQIFKPKYYIPVKGDYRQMIINGRVAESIGKGEEDIIIMDNGEMITFENGVLLPQRASIPAGSLMIDGIGFSDVGSKVIDDRIALSKDGFVIIGVSIDRVIKKIVAGPDIQMRGLVYLKDNTHLTEEVSKITTTMINDINIETYDLNELKMELRDRIQKYISKETKKRPIVLAVVLEVNE